MKTCSKCKKEKSLSEFNKYKNTKDNLQRYCRQCQKDYQKSTLPKWREYNKKYREKHPEKNRERSKNYYENNKESHLQRMKIWRESNKEYIKDYSQKDEVKESRRVRQKEKRKDPKFKLYENIRNRIYKAVKLYQYEKKSSSIEELGCSIEEYFVYLEQQFDKNMNWDNYGIYWEIDHIDPIVKSGNFHYTNTRPLSITENRKKGKK